jgi:microcin C transport system substrate-binding protein
MQRVLYWDKFSRPAVTPRNGTSIDYWWFDEIKAARLENLETSPHDSSKEQAGSSSGTGLAMALGVLMIVGIGATVALKRRRQGKLQQ